MQRRPRKEGTIMRRERLTAVAFGILLLALTWAAAAQAGIRVG
jgi:hypothetical protein